MVSPFKVLPVIFIPKPKEFDVGWRLLEVMECVKVVCVQHNHCCVALECVICVVLCAQFYWPF